MAEVVSIGIGRHFGALSSRIFDDHHGDFGSCQIDRSGDAKLLGMAAETVGTVAFADGVAIRAGGDRP